MKLQRNLNLAEILRPFLLFILVALGLASLAARALPNASQPPGKPNVLLLCVDDLKPLLHSYGDPLAHTPNLDRLARRGVQFERAYTNQAVCAPSRNALMTGLRPQTLGIYDLPTNFRRAVPEAVTVAQYFQRNGYRTEALGKIMHTGHGNQEDAASWTVPPWRPGGSSYALPATLAAIEQRVAQARADGVPAAQMAAYRNGPATEMADVPDNAYADGKIADEAIRRLAAAAAKPAEPWFIGVGFIKPHLPFCAPKKYWDLYDAAKLPLPAHKVPPLGAPAFAPTRGLGELRLYSDMTADQSLDEARTRRVIHGYYAAVSYMDAQLGRVLEAFDRHGFGKNSIIVLWGDHGWHLGDHGLWAKHTNYEQATRIPLIIAAPGVPGNTRPKALIETVDLYPTLCELAGLPAPAGLEGKSFVPVLKNPAREIRDHVIHVYPRGSLLGRALRTARYRLVEWKAPGAAADTAQFELYDYEADAAETKNLAPEQPKVVARLRALLAQHPEAKPQIPK